MRGKRNTDRSVRKFITIRDTELWEKIDKIMEEPKYAKSFNKVINDALYFGLDELMRHLFEPEETVEDVGKTEEAEPEETVEDSEKSEEVPAE